MLNLVGFSRCSVFSDGYFFPCVQDCDNLWWDAFTTEFFEDDAMLTITFCLEDGPKRYSEKPFVCGWKHWWMWSSLLWFHVLVWVWPNPLLFSAIGRTLIPRYFRSIFEGGATELFYVLKHPKESFHSNFVSLDCDQCTMVTQNGKPMFTQVRSPVLRIAAGICQEPANCLPWSFLTLRCASKAACT